MKKISRLMSLLLVIILVLPAATLLQAEENMAGGLVEMVSDGAQEAPSGAEPTIGSAKTNTTYTVYISGIDNRGDLIEKSRSDVNIIATLNSDTKQCLLVNTPRDYFVPLSISGGVPDKLTHAGIYGVQVSMDTLGMLYDRDIIYYFRINFGGFQDLIDSLGGITVWSDFTFDARGCTFYEGWNDLDGEAALVFARERYSFASGDRQRGKNQMAVIKAVVKKLMEGNTAANLTNVLGMMGTLFETNIPLTDILAFASGALSDPDEWNIVSYSVDGTGDTQVPYSMSQAAYVMVPDMSTVEHAKELMDQVLRGEVPEA
ncbi:MAG: LCP family protein [Blautia sp.]|nr:LCP family protein [Blautia sp.]